MVTGVTSVACTHRHRTKHSLLHVHVVYLLIDIFNTTRDEDCSTPAASTSQMLQLAAQLLPSTDDSCQQPPRTGGATATPSSGHDSGFSSTGYYQPSSHGSSSASSQDANPLLRGAAATAAGFRGYTMLGMPPDMTSSANVSSFAGERYYQHLEVEQRMKKLDVADSKGAAYKTINTNVDQDEELDVTIGTMNDSFFKVDTPRRSRLAARFDMSSFERE